jgi:hypothetical protein
MNCLPYLFTTIFPLKNIVYMKKLLLASLLTLFAGGLAMAGTTTVAQAHAGKGKPGMHKKHHHKHHHHGPKKHA